MSLSGALQSAISGMSAQSQSLAMVSDNLANSTTTAYKTTSGLFYQLVTGSSGTGQYASGGVTIAGRTNVTQQGLPTQTSNPTDMAIQGQGFFVVSGASNGGNVAYTRNGAFSPDNSGFLTNNGYYLMGWPTDSSGNVVTGSTLQPINTASAAVSGAPTTTVSLVANLPADAAVNDTFNTSMPVYDSLGTAATVQITWKKTATNTWTASFGNATLASDPTKTVGTTTGSLTVAFNSDGSIDSVTPAASTVSIAGWTTGATDSTIKLDFGQSGGSGSLTQFSSGAATPDVSVTSVTPDGLPFGRLSGISIGKDGIVNATYSNGQTTAIYKVAVATFASPDNLSAQSDGIYLPTIASGNAIVQASGTGGAGTILGGQLEASTTNTSEEFSTMMQAQQAYSASAQVISTVSKMFDTLINNLR